MRERQEQAHPDHRDHHDGQRSGARSPFAARSASRPGARRRRTRGGPGSRDRTSRRRSRAGAKRSGRASRQARRQPASSRSSRYSARGRPRPPRSPPGSRAPTRSRRSPRAGPTRPQSAPGSARGHHGVVEPVIASATPPAVSSSADGELARHDDRLRQSSSASMSASRCSGLSSAGRVMTIAASAPSAATAVRPHRQADDDNESAKGRRAMGDIALSRACLKRTACSESASTQARSGSGRQPYTVHAANPSVCPPLVAGMAGSRGRGGRAEAAAVAR